MPILDVQTEDQRLPRLGIIRLGIRKTSENSGKKYPAESPHFILTDAPDVAEAYEPDPTEILIYLPFARTDDNFIAHHEMWGKSGICKCRGDGEKIIDLFDAKGIDRVVREGRVIKAFESNGTHYAEGDVLPCPGMKHGMYPRCAECKPSGLLIVLVRDPMDPGQLVSSKLGYYQIHTNSYRNIKNLTAQLRFVEERQRMMGRTLQGVPMILKRVPREVSFVGTDKDTGEPMRSTSTKYFLDLEFDLEWVRRTSEAMRTLAMGEDAPVLQLPYPTEFEDGEDGHP